MAALNRAANDPAATSDVSGVLQMLVGYDNVPRKAGRFKNFATNSLAMRGRDELLQRTFDFIMSHWPKPSATKKSEDSTPVAPDAAADTGAGAGAGAGAAEAAAEATTPAKAKKEKKSKKAKKAKKEKKDKVDTANGEPTPASPATKKRARSTDAAESSAGDEQAANGSASKRVRERRRDGGWCMY